MYLVRMLHIDILMVEDTDNYVDYIFLDRGGDGDTVAGRGTDVVGSANITVGGGAGHGGFGGASDYDSYNSGRFNEI